MLLFETLGPAGPLSRLVKTQKAFTFPAKENDQPFDICIVRPCALAVEATPSAKPNNNSVRRFIRESLLGSLRRLILPLVLRGAIRQRPRQVQPSGNVVLPPVILVWLLTYSCTTDRKAESTSSC